jgi:hypothetical protein
MIAPALLLTIQVLVSQAPAAQEQVLPGAERPGLLLAATEPAPPARPSLLPDSSQPQRPSRAWVLVRAPLALGAGAVTGLAVWVVSYTVISIGTVPFGCLDFKTVKKEDWCFDAANLSAFVMAGVGSGAAVAGVGALLFGEGDPRAAMAAGLLGGIGFGAAYLLGDNPKEVSNFQGDQARVHRLAFVAVPVLAILSYELSALFLPGRPAPLTPAVVPTAGGGLLLVGGRF